MTEEGLSTFERGRNIGEGVATIATFFVGWRINTAANQRLPMRITNLTRGNAWHCGGKFMWWQ